jgi:rhamnosyltransferase
MASNQMKIALIIPTLNAARHWPALYEGIRRQSVSPTQVIVIDSASTDDTVARARAAGFAVIEIDRREFNHGGSRQAAACAASSAEILIYLTQDAIPQGREAFRELIDAFRDGEVGAAYGRQVPRQDATGIEAHARLFNYPAESRVRSLECRKTLGFKSIFFSNAFGAYRREALTSVGGFADVIFGEDTLAVAQLHLAGWKSAYVAEARVEHSHDFPLGAEFRRFFDIGVLHQRERWLIEQFGSTTGEGRRFVMSELRYLWENDRLQIPSALLRSAMKYIGYQVGRREANVPAEIKRHLSTNREYWLEQPIKNRDQIVRDERAA